MRGFDGGTEKFPKKNFYNFEIFSQIGFFKWQLTVLLK